MEPHVRALAEAIGFDLPERYNAARLLWDNLPARADRPAVIADAATWSYGALAAEAARIGNALLAAGARPGDRVLLHLDDTPVYPAAIMGAMRAGLVPMLINTLSTPDLLRFYLEDSGAVAAVVERAHLPLFDAGARAGTACRHVFAPGDWDGAPATLDEAPTRRGDMAFWMYSSGSTGRPKGVVHRHEDAAYTHASYARHVLKLTGDDICFSVPKIFFAYGFGNSVTFPFAAGAAAVLMAGRPEPGRIFAAIARHRPTVFFGLPTLYTALARAPEAAAADLASLRLCISAAEILSEEVAGAWRALSGHEIVEGLGSTEMLHIYLTNAPGNWRRGSAGRVVPGYAVRLIGPDGAEAATGEEGVMQVAGLSALREYWNRPDKTAETLQGGWVDTGDRFVADAEGFHYFKGRADDLVKVSGQWVWPMEIEQALNEHPAVHESCVLALPMADERMTVAAWVVLKPGHEPGEAVRRQLKDHAKAMLLPHKYPRRIIFLDSLPKTGTGKIDRQALRRRAD